MKEGTNFLLHTHTQNLHWKLRHKGAICWSRKELFWPYGLDHIFSRNKNVFVFQDSELKFSASVWFRISWNLTKFELIQLIQTTFILIFSMGSLNELQFCEVSRNPQSKRCWKFQLSILKNKKVLFLKNYFLSQEWTGFNIKTTSFVYCPNFQWRFCSYIFKLIKTHTSNGK